jgi:hypothetical protein
MAPTIRCCGKSFRSILSVRGHSSRLVFSVLKVTSFSGKTKGWEEKARPNGFIGADYERRATSYKPQATSHELQAASHMPQATNNKLTNPI